jgi:peptide methionine sulfoxide reductase MsrB
MQNLAYKIDVRPEGSESCRNPKQSQKSTDVCAACGEELFGPDAEACSWQAWGSFWEIMGMSDVELVCGACGQYLSDFFRNDPK